MTRSARSPKRLVGALVAGCVVGGVALAAVPGGGVEQAVISFHGTPDLTGVHVLERLPALHMAVVRGTPAQLRQLKGITGIAPDDTVHLTDDGESGSGRAVLASDGLGGDAGQPGAGVGVRVAVIDTGVSDTDALNRDSGRLIDAVDTSHLGEQRTGGTYTDGYGHGTFMASVLAGGPVDGTDGQALGVAPGATVLVVKVAKRNGSTSLSRVLSGLDWVADHHDEVDIANLSLSHDRPGDEYGSDPLTDAVETVRNAGVTVVVSSGNDRGTVGDPGFDPQVLTVGAANIRTGRVAPFSGSDDVDGVAKPDVVASGVRVLGELPLGSVIEQEDGTTHLANGLFRGSGTSQAAAITSGLAAIFLAANPGATPAEVKASIRCAAGDLRGHRDGEGLVQTTTDVCSDGDGQALDGSGDLTGLVDFDANSWAANSWAANSWAANSWAANSWAANSWAANSWASDSFGDDQ